MFKRKESLNFYALLIRQAQVIRDAVEALCAFCEDPTQEKGDFVKVKEKEADAIRGKLPASAYVIAMCVEGKTRSSEELARLMADSASRGDSHLVFLIGGSFGLHPSVKELAAVKLSMSPMTFPHHLARVMLLEQIYRAYQINAGSKYHK